MSVPGRTSTPTSDITVLAPGEPSIDATPMKRHEALSNGRANADQTLRRDQSPSRSGSPSANQTSSSPSDQAATLGRPRNIAEAPKRSLDLADTSARHCRLKASNSASWSLDVSGEDILMGEGKGDVEGLAS